ncbi:hypothetical protein KK083_07265 [Fulvivirgaceae bacterium PWU4]|uniref:Uncharacterized protein n=1 Tax=Chryseosolibacter histidini TaxID=2782349 RepID=A0AAP2GI26_9BACT|nr:hypothetical protein [Chryseosolibacter histidini]MBT1696666.1 hypothetical protein [Chryseosolibacter histidini]
MGLIDLFKKSKKRSATTDNGVLGPTYLDGFTEQISEPEDLQKHEWRRKLRTASGQTKFRIRYFGQLHTHHRNLIVGTEEAPSLVVAVDPASAQEIILFDGCKHGYNAMFCEQYSAEQKSRVAGTFYKDPNGNDTFEITLSTYNGIDYDDEFADKVDADGYITLIDGTRMDFGTVKRNGFDTLQISGLTEAGKVIEIVSEELA